MKKISTVLITMMIALFVSGSSFAKTSGEIYFSDGHAKANAPFYIPIEKLYPEMYYIVYCDMINYSNEVISFSVTGDGNNRYYAATYLNDEAFAKQTHLRPGKSKLKLDWISFHDYPHHNRNIMINSADQTYPIFMKNCYAVQK